MTARDLSSLVIDWLCDQVGKRDIAVAGLYCDYLAREQHSQSSSRTVVDGSRTVSSSSWMGRRQGRPTAVDGSPAATPAMQLLHHFFFSSFFNF